MKLENYNNLSLGKKVLVIIGLNIVMLMIFSIAMFGNVSTIIEGATNDITLMSGFSIVGNIYIIFIKFIVFAIPYIIINILLIINKLKAAIVIFAMILILIVMGNIISTYTYHQIANDIDQFTSEISQLSETIGTQFI